MKKIIFTTLFLFIHSAYSVEISDGERGFEEYISFITTEVQMCEGSKMVFTTSNLNGDGKMAVVFVIKIEKIEGQEITITQNKVEQKIKSKFIGNFFMVPNGLVA